MAHSRNFQRSRKNPDQVKEHLVRETLLAKATLPEVDLTPINPVSSISKHRQRYSVYNRESGLQVIFTGEVAHVRRIQ